MNKTRSNKISDKQKKAAERTASRLKKQGVGQDEAEKQALRQIATQKRSGHGGGSNAGGEARKPTRAGRLKQRTGSDSHRQR
jgi:hypothetical protein